MNKITVADINIEFESDDYNFFNKRTIEYINLFDNTDLIIKTKCFNKVKLPKGKLLLEINNTKINQLNDGRLCRYTIDKKSSEIIKAIYYDEQYSDIEIHILKNRIGSKLTSTDNEYIYSGLAFNDKITKLGGAVLHGSAISYKGDGIVFSADSGIGKSTHTGLWKKIFSDDVKFVNDDKPAIRFYDNYPYIFGTPWSGKTDLNMNIKVPLKAIVFLKRDSKNSIEKLNVKESMFYLLGQINRSLFDHEISKLTFDVLEKLILKVPIYRLNCNLSDEAVYKVFNELYGGI